MVLTVEKKEKITNETILKKQCINNTPVNTKFNKDTLEQIGQGEGNTK